MINLLTAFISVPFFHRPKISSESGVLILTKNNFHKAVDQHEPILVKFYLPWCKRCRAFAPEYLRVAEILKNSPIKLAQVDAETERTLVQEQKISTLPAVKLFHNGSSVTYFGLREAEHIAAWAKKNCELN